eukprot:gene15845-17826_t
MVMSRQQLVYRAELSLQTERYQEMLAFVKQFYNGGIESPELTSEERNLLLIAYKNVLSPKQRAWRIVTSLEKEEEE